MGNQPPSKTMTTTTKTTTMHLLSPDLDRTHSHVHNDTQVDGRYAGHDRRIRNYCSSSNKGNVQSQQSDPQKQRKRQQQQQRQQPRPQLSKMERLWMEVATSAAVDETNCRTVTPSSPPPSSVLLPSSKRMIDVYQTYSTVMVPSSSQSLSSSSSSNGSSSSSSSVAAETHSTTMMSISPTKSAVVKKTKTTKMSLSHLSSLSSSRKKNTSEDDGDIDAIALQQHKQRRQQQQQQEEKEAACQMWRDMVLGADMDDEINEFNEDDRREDVGGVTETKNKKKNRRNHNRHSLGFGGHTSSKRRTNGIPFRKCYDPSCECNCNNSSSTTTTKSKPVTTTEPSTPSTVALSVESNITTTNTTTSAAATAATTASPSWTLSQQRQQEQKRHRPKEEQKQQQSTTNTNRLSSSSLLSSSTTTTGEVVPYCVLQTIQQSRQIHDSKEDDNSYDEDSRRYDTIMDRCIACNIGGGGGEEDDDLVGLEVPQQQQQHSSSTTRNHSSLDGVNKTPSSNGDIVHRDEMVKKRKNKKKNGSSRTIWASTSRVRSVDYYMPQRRRRSEDIVDMACNDPLAIRSSDSIKHEKPLYLSSSSSKQMFQEGNDTKTKQHGPLRPRSGSTTSGYGTRPSPTSVIHVKHVDKGLPSMPLYSNQPIPIDKDCHVRNTRSSHQSTRSSTRRQDSVDMIEGRLDECRQNAFELKRKRHLYAHDPVTRQHLSVEMARIYNRMAMLHVQAGRYSTALYVFEHSIDTLTSNIVVRSADGTPYSHLIMIRTLEESTGFMIDSAFFTAIDACLGLAKVYARQRCWQQCKSLSKKVVTLLHTEGRSRLLRTPQEIYRRMFNNDEEWSVLFGRAQVLLGQVYHHYHHRVDLALRYYNDVLSWYHSTITTATTVTTRQRCLVADTTYHMGNLHSSQGMISLAAVCYRNAATMYMGLLSGCHTNPSQRTWFPTIMSDAASALGCHGWTLFWQGRFEESWYTTRHALDWTIESLGQRHRNVSTLQSQLGWISYILVCFTDPQQPRGRSTAGRRRIPATQFCNNTANDAAVIGNGII